MRTVETGVLCAAAAGTVDLPTVAARLERDEATIRDVAASLARRDLLVVDRDAIRLAPGHGYDAVTLESILPAGYELAMFDRVESTNATAGELLDAGVDARVLVVAERQARGRGRRGRDWHSPPGGIWASIGDGRPRPVATAWLEQFALSLAVIDVTDALGVECRLKWPNDVLGPDGGKLAGVLVQSVSRGPTRRSTICGVGLNANVDPSTIPPHATTLASLCGPVERWAVLGHLVTAFERRRERASRTRTAWLERAETVGRRVVIDTPDGELVGTATGLTGHGDLVLATDSGRRTVPVSRCERLRYDD
ncbi:MAG: biotin--[acetyl-CoA-carboxylase] ligase [Halobacteriota archaeon]